MINEDHVCEWPEHGNWNTYPLKWNCPICGQKWVEAADIFDGEDEIYWERA